jgi:hypothetical protein
MFAAQVQNIANGITAGIPGNWLVDVIPQCLSLSSYDALSDPGF